LICVPDEIRKKAWPLILNITDYPEKAPTEEELEMHPEYRQVVMDVNRSLKRFPPGKVYFIQTIKLNIKSKYSLYNFDFNFLVNLESSQIYIQCIFYFERYSSGAAIGASGPADEVNSQGHHEVSPPLLLPSENLVPFAQKYFN